MKRSSERRSGPALDASRIERIRDELHASLGSPLTVVAATGSTNDDARRAAAAGAPHGAAFVADEQSAGRGRGDHRWHSPPGQSVYLSVILRPTLDASALAPLTLAVGLAVAKVADDALGATQAQLKWPNDVYLGGRKLAGVLVEALMRGDDPPVLVVGVGFNVLTTHFPAQLEATATSLRLAGGEGLDRERIAARLLTRIGEHCDRFMEQRLAAFAAELAARDFLRGRPLTAGALSGTAEGIDARGRLLLRDERGNVHLISTGEVHLSTAP